MRVSLQWSAVTASFNRLESDRRTWIEIAMAIVAVLSAVVAFRATEVERKSVTCDHLAQAAQTYELVQRQRYLDEVIENRRWSGRYDVATHRSETLLKRADTMRQTRRTSSDDIKGGLLRPKRKSKMQ